MATEKPTCRWGIVSTGLISSWFVEDLQLERRDAKANHIIQCIGSSSLEKGQAFVAKHCPKIRPIIYTSYDGVYTDPDVDCVYIGTPHSFHKQNCLDAIAAGKNVLCEKPFAINAREAEEVLEAARQKGVYVHEAMWLRHRPLVFHLRKLLYEDRAIGEVFRMRSDFAMFMDIPNLPETSRYKDLKLGAGSLLDIGIYSLTWGILTLDPDTPSRSEDPKILAAQTHEDGIEVTSSVILQYPASGRQGIISSTTMSNAVSDLVCRIQGTEGYVDVEGSAPSHPASFTVYKKQKGAAADALAEVTRYDYSESARGFIYEADDTALDLAAGRKESPIMPWKETIRVMEILDEIRRQGGTRYPQDGE
ncbi:putative D-xylose 1-dehydrogenase (NADP(+)) [Exophiala dermatitidis]